MLFALLLLRNTLTHFVIASYDVASAIHQPLLLGDPELPPGALVGADLAYSPSFANVTRFYTAAVASTRVLYLELNATAASSLITGITVNGRAVQADNIKAHV